MGGGVTIYIYIYKEKKTYSIQASALNHRGRCWRQISRSCGNLGRAWDGLGFQGLGFKVWGLGVQGLGFLCLRFRDSGLGFRA